MLRALKVEPKVETLTDKLRAEFAAVVDDLGGHALALNLAGRWVAEHRGGQLKAIRDIPQLEQHENVNEAYRSPFRVFRSMELGLLKTMNDHAANGDDPLDSPAARQLALLYFVGLFDRPAEVRLLDVVFSGSESRQDFRQGHHRAIPQGEPTETLGEFRYTTFDTLPVAELFAAFGTASREAVRFAFGQLARQGLVDRRWLGEQAPIAWEQTLIDCHPLVREYFGERLEHLAADTFRAAHGRLYDHFRFEGLPQEFCDPVAYGALALKSAFPDAPVENDIEKLANGTLPPQILDQWPPTFRTATSDAMRAAVSAIRTGPFATALAAFRPEDGAGMEPLFAAITHGCLARRHDECFNEVYWPRIARGNEKFATAKLGL